GLRADDGISGDHSSDGFYARRHTPRGPDDLWPSLGRRASVRVRLCVRTGDAPPQPSTDHPAAEVNAWVRRPLACYLYLRRGVKRSENLSFGVNECPTQ